MPTSFTHSPSGQSRLVFTVLTALFFTSVLAATASAYSNGACVNNGIEGCNAQHPNNYKARLACANSVVTQCAGHSHGGGGNGVDSASNNFTSSGNRERNRARIKSYKPPQKLKFKR